MIYKNHTINNNDNNNNDNNKKNHQKHHNHSCYIILFSTSYQSLNFWYKNMFSQQLTTIQCRDLPCRLNGIRWGHLLFRPGHIGRRGATKSLDNVLGYQELSKGPGQGSMFLYVHKCFYKCLYVSICFSKFLYVSKRFYMFLYVSLSFSKFL